MILRSGANLQHWMGDENALSFTFHTTKPRMYVPFIWNFQKGKKEIWIQRSAEDGSSDWISSQAFSVDGKDGHFAAKMYRPSRHEQYFVLTAVSRLAGGVSAIVIERADQSTPPYRIVNACGNRLMIRERCQQVHLSLYKPRTVDAAAAAVTGLTRRNILAGHIKFRV